MEDILKKFIYTGVGLLSLTTTKFKEMLDELIRDRKISEDEGKRLLDDFLAKAKGSQEDFEQQINTVAAQFGKDYKKNTHDEMESLKERVAILESKLNTYGLDTENLTMERDPLQQQKRAAAGQEQSTKNEREESTGSTVNKVKNSERVSLADDVLTPQKKMEAERQRMQQQDRPASQRHEEDNQKTNLGEPPLTPDKKMEEARKNAR
jgi:polyhydroxyalkanoate synthesis regulator phasin